MSKKQKTDEPAETFKYANLQQAVRCRDLPELEHMITCGRWDLNTVNQPILHLAVTHNYPEIVEYLLKAGADLELCDSSDCTPLAHAIRNGRTDIAYRLIAAGANIESVLGVCSVLQVEITLEGNLHVVKAMLHGKNLTLDYNYTDNRGDHLIHWAARANRIDIVRHLIKQGISVNKMSNSAYTPLHYAVSYDHFELTRWLVLVAGADVHSLTLDSSPACIRVATGRSWRWLLRRPGCDLNLTPDDASEVFKHGFRTNLNDCDIDNDACNILALALESNQFRADTIDFSGNPRIGLEGITALANAFRKVDKTRFNKFVISQLPLRWLNKLKAAAEPKKIKIQCPFPSLLVITSFYIARYLEAKKEITSRLAEAAELLPPGMYEQVLNHLFQNTL